MAILVSGLKPYQKKWAELKREVHKRKPKVLLGGMVHDPSKCVLQPYLTS